MSPSDSPCMGRGSTQLQTCPYPSNLSQNSLLLLASSVPLPHSLQHEASSIDARGTSALSTTGEPHWWKPGDLEKDSPCTRPFFTRTRPHMSRQASFEARLEPNLKIKKNNSKIQFFVEAR